MSLDDFMRAMWQQHRQPGGRPGYVHRPYTLADAEERLGEVSGDTTFAADFFRRYVFGRDVPDFAKLLDAAGIILRRTSPRAAYVSGLYMDSQDPAKVGRLVTFGSPAFEAGLEMGDTILTFGGVKFTTLQEALQKQKPMDVVDVEFRRPSGEVVRGKLRLDEDPRLQAVTVESTGAPLSSQQRIFRDAWLGTKVR